MNNASANTSASNTPQTTGKAKAASGSNWRTAKAANQEGLRGYGDTVMARLQREKNLPRRPRPSSNS